MQEGLYGWFLKNLRGKKGQQGFTLIELLVVVTILGILAAIVTLSLVGLTGNATTQSCNTEYKTVQDALDTYMASNNITSLPNGDQTAWTNDMSGSAHIGVSGNLDNGTVPLFVLNPSPTNPNYTRNGTTQFYYTWLASGRINGIASSPSGAAVNGCTPK